MAAATAPFTARARTDADDRLVEAEEPLAGLQLRSGGELPGVIANPALLALVRKARHYGLHLAQPLHARDDAEDITAWVEVAPEQGGKGCVITVANWQATPAREDDADGEAASRERAIIRQISELSATLGPAQEVIAVEARAPDLQELSARMAAGIGTLWTEFMGLDGPDRGSPLHWRLLDGAEVKVAGSERSWRTHLVPLGMPVAGSAGFELHLVADTPLPEPAPRPAEPARSTFSSAMGREIAPVLRQPIARIIANAETIRTQLAGPLSEEYSNYAADIATAGEHLLALLDDLVALEVVEDDQFAPAPDAIDLGDVARRAAGILGVRARERGMTVEAPATEVSAPAIGEFRRVLQILLNLLGNAIRYSPEGSRVTITVERSEQRARAIVADEGTGLSDQQQARLFDKFERLGRQGDGGTGLGLYISRRLARAMDGDLRVESAAGQGARFILELPAEA